MLARFCAYPTASPNARPTPARAHLRPRPRPRSQRLAAWAAADGGARAEAAAALWAKFEALTAERAQRLCEQLRLILEVRPSVRACACLLPCLPPCELATTFTLAMAAAGAAAPEMTIKFKPTFVRPLLFQQFSDHSAIEPLPFPAFLPALTLASPHRPAGWRSCAGRL